MTFTNDPLWCEEGMKILGSYRAEAAGDCDESIQQMLKFYNGIPKPTPAENVVKLVSLIEERESLINNLRQSIKKDIIYMDKQKRALEKLQGNLENLTQQTGEKCPHLPVKNTEGVEFVL